MRAPDIPALPPYAIKHASKMHQNAAKNTAIMQHNASPRHTRFASLRSQKCIKMQHDIQHKIQQARNTMRTPDNLALPPYAIKNTSKIDQKSLKYRSPRHLTLVGR